MPPTAPPTSRGDAGIRRSVHAAVNPPSVTFPPPVSLPKVRRQKFQKGVSQRKAAGAPTAGRRRALRVAPSGGLGSIKYGGTSRYAARVGVAAWGLAGCRPRRVTAPTTGSPAAAPMLGRPAPARCPVLGRCPSPGPNAGSMASSATWSPRGTKVPGQNPLVAAIQGPERARRSLARAAALRRARAPRRREGRFVYRESQRRESPRAILLFFGTQFRAPALVRCEQRTGARGAIIILHILVPL